MLSQSAFPSGPYHLDGRQGSASAGNTPPGKLRRGATRPHTCGPPASNAPGITSSFPAGSAARSGHANPGHDDAIGTFAPSVHINRRRLNPFAPRVLASVGFWRPGNTNRIAVALMVLHGGARAWPCSPQAFLNGQGPDQNPTGNFGAAGRSRKSMETMAHIFGQGRRRERRRSIDSS
jgi:hypothetical protein